MQCVETAGELVEMVRDRMTTSCSTAAAISHSAMLLMGPPACVSHMLLVMIMKAFVGMFGEGGGGVRGGSWGGKGGGGGGDGGDGGSDGGNGGL